MRRRPPLGILPAWLWREQEPSPSRAALRRRAAVLTAAIVRYRRAGRVERTEWLEELAALRRLPAAAPSGSQQTSPTEPPPPAARACPKS